MKAARLSFTVLVSILALGLPVLFAFAPSGAVPGSDPLAQLYQPLKILLGERAARFVFCFIWLAVDAVFLWWLFIRRHKDDGPPVDYLAD
jgi:hypothetical protein